MNCNCGVPAFFYETIKTDCIKYSIYKCGTLSSETKKGKCDFNIEIPLNKIILPQCNSIQIDFKPKIHKYESEIIKDLERYINLFQISKNNYSMSRDNYVSNINFFLKRLNFPLFFPKKEKIESLKSRIYNIPFKKTIKKTEYPILILEIPENLKIQNKKLVNKYSNQSSNQSYNQSFIKGNKYGISRVVLLPTDELLNKIKEMEIKSDSDSESEKEDNSFDVDNYDSDVEDTFFEDGGGLSD